MSVIKEAADRLLSRGEISEEEYKGIDFDNFEKLAKAKGIKRFFTYLKAQAKHPTMVKTPTDIMKKTFKTRGVDALLVGAGIALAKESLIDPIVGSAKIQSSYSQLAKKTPQLAEKDKDQIKDYFNVIKTFSPKAASNPLVAGALVNKMIEFGGVDHKLVQDIASIEAGAPGLLGKARENIIKSVVGAAAAV